VRILLAEDELSLGDAAARALRSQKWTVDWKREGGSVPDAIKKSRYDLVILDVGLPVLDGFEILRRLRAQGYYGGIIMLTERDDVEDRVYGFRQGADDYLVKPFSLTELIARIQAIARRLHTKRHNEILFGDLCMDLTAKRAFLAGAPLDLLPREWAVLECLMDNSGKLVSKEQILGALPKRDTLPPSLNAIEVYVSRLRTKLAPAGIIIRTVRGFGYRVEESAHGRNRADSVH
jgi:two-component system OmpR family response regulator